MFITLPPLCHILLMRWCISTGHLCTMLQWIFYLYHCICVPVLPTISFMRSVFLLFLVSNFIGISDTVIHLVDIYFQLEDAVLVLCSLPPFSFHGLITLVISVDRQATRQSSEGQGTWSRENEIYFHLISCIDQLVIWQIRNHGVLLPKTLSGYCRISLLIKHSPTPAGN